MVGQETNQFSSPLSLILLPGLDGTGELFQWFLDALPPLKLRPIVVAFPKDADDDYAALETHVLRFSSSRAAVCYPG